MDKYINYVIGISYDEIKEGQVFVGHPITVTESHITIFAGLSGDFNPLHVDETFSRQSVFNSRVAHGLLVMSMMSGSLGMTFAGTAIALTEFHAKFIKPVRIGDTIRPEAEVVSKKDSKSYNGGYVTLKINIKNQNNEIVAEGSSTLLVKRSSNEK